MCACVCVCVGGGGTGVEEAGGIEEREDRNCNCRAHDVLTEYADLSPVPTMC